jgi:hypothetical protein
MKAIEANTRGGWHNSSGVELQGWRRQALVDAPSAAPSRVNRRVWRRSGGGRRSSCRAAPGSAPPGGGDRQRSGTAPGGTAPSPTLPRGEDPAPALPPDLEPAPVLAHLCAHMAAMTGLRWRLTRMLVWQEKREGGGSDEIGMRLITTTMPTTYRG